MCRVCAGVCPHVCLSVLAVRPARPDGLSVLQPHGGSWPGETHTHGHPAHPHTLSPVSPDHPAGPCRCRCHTSPGPPHHRATTCAGNHCASDGPGCASAGADACLPCQSRGFGLAPIPAGASAAFLPSGAGIGPLACPPSPSDAAPPQPAFPVPHRSPAAGAGDASAFPPSLPVSLLPPIPRRRYRSFSTSSGPLPPGPLPVPPRCRHPWSLRAPDAGLPGRAARCSTACRRR